MILTRVVLLVLCLLAPVGVGGAAAQASQTLPRPGDLCDVAADSVAATPEIRPALGLRAGSTAAALRMPWCSAPTGRGLEADDVSEWYGHRLTLHRYAAWTAVAAFPVEIYTGWRLRSAGADPEWVRDAHRATVWVLGTTFTVNTVTGVWNWWDSRKEPEGRGWRTAHTLVMLAADAAMFATAREGQARARGEGGKWHRELGFTTAGLTALGHLMMLGPFRRD